MFIDFSTGLPDCLMGTPSANLVDLWGGVAIYIYMYIHICIYVNVNVNVNTHIVSRRRRSHTHQTIINTLTYTRIFRFQRPFQKGFMLGWDLGPGLFHEVPARNYLSAPVFEGPPHTPPAGIRGHWTVPPLPSADGSSGF